MIERSHKTHCYQGHLYDTANTYVQTDGYWVCRTCRKDSDRRRSERERACAVKDMTIGTGNYADTGCEVSPLCEACPLPKCKHDLTPAELWASTNQARDMKIRKLGKLTSVAVIAEAGGISTRTVHRVLAMGGNG